MEQALLAFLASDDFASAVISSTRAGWNGESYSVELFGDGTYRVVWSCHIGNLYRTPGMLLGIPQFDGEVDLFELAEAEQQLREAFAFALAAE